MPNPYQRIADRLRIGKIITQASIPNDLLPPRPEDKVSGEVGKRYSEHLVRQLQKGEYDPISGTDYSSAQVTFCNPTCCPLVAIRSSRV